jgi:hypothetical protein
MAEHSVIIDHSLHPAQISISTDDTIVWINSSQQVQTVTSDDNGQTFTTGPIQINSRSLPIVFSKVSTGVPYTCTSGLKGTVIVQARPIAVSFAATIKPYFTAVDRNAMIDPQHTFGIITFDLWSRDDCEANWDAINAAITNGSMPPAGPGSDGPWPQAKIDQFIRDFAGWKDGGFQP